MTRSLYVFDAYGTLLDVHSAVMRHGEEIGEEAARLSELWRTKQLEYSWVRSLMGRYRDFQVLTEAALDHAIARHGGLARGLREKLLDAYADLDAYPDARPALSALKRAGARTAILSNGSPAMLERAVGASGLRDCLDASLSVDALQVFKTDPRVYGLVGARFGTAPGEVVFVSSNRWDVAGATAYGFETYWINRAGLPDEYEDLPPKAVLGSLAELPRPG
ncbi:MAG TPA: haloacid dehalogenase type II [Lichenihabitans sp.]|jgi:2-haloacid dehalogenase|nr:haloacid dehalogenase type II [Lichenihabitans sp.]